MYAILAIVGALLVGIVIVSLYFRRHALPCPVWLRWCVELDNPFSKTNRASFIVSHLDLGSGMSVLDAGCGPGRVTLPLARQVGPEGEVAAVDLQSGMLDRVREKVRAAGLENVRFLQAGLGDGKLERGHFDRAVLVTVLGEVPDRERALKEIFDALKPGGVLSVTEIILDPHFQSRWKVIQLAESVGFREKAFWGGRLAYTLHVAKPGNRF